MLKKPKLQDDGDEKEKRAAIALGSWNEEDARMAQAQLRAWISAFGDEAGGPSLAMLKELARNIPDDVCRWADIDEFKDDIMQKQKLHDDIFKFALKTFCSSVTKFLEMRASHARRETENAVPDEAAIEEVAEEDV